MASSSSFPSIVFFGNERLATGVSTNLPVLRALVDAGYPIEAVIVNHDTATSRKQRKLEIADFAAEQGIPLRTAFDKNISSSVGVLVAYGRIVPQHIIDHFKYGIINVHPSQLPRYRGSTPLESVMLEGLDTTAVSLMQLSAKMDAGPIYAQNDLLQIRYKSKQDLADDAGKLGAEMLIDALPHILRGELKPWPQNDAEATITNQIAKQDGRLDWHKPAAQLEREIRAYAGWPSSTTELGGKAITITGAEILDVSGRPGKPFLHNKQLAIYCAQQALLITELKPAGKQAMTSQAYLAGNPI